VQIGAPAEIYNRPANLAVANFVGDFNIFEPETVARLFAKKPKHAWAVPILAVRRAQGTGRRTMPGH